jgi:hypothetical protein
MNYTHLLPVGAVVGVVVNINNYLFNRCLSPLVWLWFVVFNATFNNISVILWQSVLLEKETGVPGENH